MSKIEESIQIMQDYIKSIENVSSEASKLVDDKKKEKIRSISSKTIMTINSSISKLNNMIKNYTEDKQTIGFLDSLVSKCKKVSDYTISKIEAISPKTKEQNVIEEKEDNKKIEKETKKKRFFKLSDLIKANEKNEPEIEEDDDDEDEEKEEDKLLDNNKKETTVDNEESKYFFHSVSSSKEDNGDIDVLKVMLDDDNTNSEKDDKQKLSEQIKAIDPTNNDLHNELSNLEERLNSKYEDDNSPKNKAISELINIEKTNAHLIEKMSEVLETPILDKETETKEPTYEKPTFKIDNGLMDDNESNNENNNDILKEEKVEEVINNESLIENQESIIENNTNNTVEDNIEEDNTIDIKEEFAKEMDKVDDTFTIKPFNAINDDSNTSNNEIDEEFKEKLKELNDSINTHSVNKIEPSNNNLNNEFSKIIDDKNINGNTGKDNLLKTLELLKFTKDKLIDIYTSEETEEFINSAKLKVIDVAEKGLDILKVLLDRKDK